MELFALRCRLLLSILLVAATLGSCMLVRAPGGVVAAEGATPAASTAGPESVAVARTARLHLSRELTLTSELVPFQEVEVMAKVSGYVQKIFVDVGDHVRQGQVIAVLEVPEMKDDLARTDATIEQSRARLNQARDEVDRAERTHRIAHLSYTRLASLFQQQPGLVAQQEVDDAQAKDQIAESQVAAAKSNWLASDQQIKVGEADRGKAETLLRYTQVLAPFDGVVTKRYANQGAMVQSGVASQSQAMPLVRLSQHSRLRLVLQVPESSAGAIAAGSPVGVKVPSLHREFRALVARTSNRVATETRTMHAEVDVPNPSGDLIPGMYAEVTLRLEDRPQALAVPLTAVEAGDGGSAAVWVVSPGGLAERRRVSTGIESATGIEVTSGLQEGELVILSARGQVKNGQAVRPVPAGGR